MTGPAAGRKLAGRFLLQRPLGRGGMGEVWLADDAATGTPVALKFLGPELAATPAARAALEAECARTRGLVHPHIVAVHGFHVDGPDAFIALQYVDGDSAGALRGRGFREILAALAPVADALAYAHRQGVVHRDLKAANILRDARGRCLLSDFGAAAATGAATRGGGSLSAMGPQQLAGEPPTPSDDVYGFGTLLWDLLAGAPLFHPVTPERIRTEVPAPLIADLTGAPLPGALTRLLQALLDKNPARRPPGMDSVRAALDEILRDDAARSRPAAVIAGAAAPGSAASPGPASGRPGTTPAPLPGHRQGLPGFAVAGGAILLLGLAAFVIFFLPAIVAKRGPLVTTGTGTPPAADSAPAAKEPAAPGAPKESGSVPAPVTRESVEAVLGELLGLDDQLKKSAADRWGGADWAELRRQVSVGDEAFGRLDFGAALAAYQPALELARQLKARQPTVLKESLDAGNAALLAGDQATAVAKFDLALAMDPGNGAATTGLNRAKKLDQVLALVNRARAAEDAGRPGEALDLYRQALALDGAWAPAAEAVRRLSQAAATDQYQASMARGFEADARGDLAGARAAFEAALKVRPGDEASRSALGALEVKQKEARVVALQDEARRQEAAEKWADAARSWEAALAIDGTLAPATEGLARARQRAELDGALRQQLGNADAFNDQAVFKAAGNLLARAKAVPSPGPVLRQQVDELARLLAVAATPVTVTFESDNLTSVVIYKVGRLGPFVTKTLELRPGAYVAVGSRPGYRDVRRNFRVTADGSLPPVVVRCEETI